MKIARTTLAAFAAASILAACATTVGTARAPAWTTTWAGSPTVPVPNSAGFNNQTLRVVVHPSLGGSEVRLRLCNTFGTSTVTIGAAAIGLQSADAGITNGTNRSVTFNGGDSITIPPAALIVSDPVKFDVSDGQMLSVSLFAPVDTGPTTVHPLAMQTSYVSASGNFVASTGSESFTTKIQSAPLLCGVEVKPRAPARTIVTLGDSITDGYGSTPSANHRWPDVLSQRLQAAHRSIAVVNAGISGNRILHDAAPARPIFGPNALSRFDRDVLSISGVSHVTVLIGINDIGAGSPARNPQEAVTAVEIIGGLHQLVIRGHARGVKMIGATLTPFKGAGYFTPEGEEKRQAVNAWIRTSKEFDAVIDFDATTRDPANPAQFLPAFDSGDHLHPGDAGYRAMGESIDLGIFN
jgi:lysophospholipase L1-like esterase